MLNSKIKDVVIRQATAEDMKLFFPDGSPRTSYSWLATYKGEPACLAGLILERGGCIAYSEMREVNAPKQTIWRTARALLELIVALGLPMHAACDVGNERTQAFVQRLGFTKERKFNDSELFSWPI